MGGSKTTLSSAFQTIPAVATTGHIMDPNIGGTLSFRPAGPGVCIQNLMTEPGNANRPSLLVLYRCTEKLWYIMMCLRVVCSHTLA